MTLFETIQQDMIAAMKAHDASRLQTLRFLIAAIKKYDIDTYLPGSPKKLTEDDVLKIIKAQVKTHRESIEAFTKAGRSELAQKEQAELDVLLNYAPKELTDAEIEVLVKEVIDSGTTQFGAVMGASMKKIAGRADGARVTAVVKKLLQ